MSDKIPPRPWRVVPEYEGDEWPGLVDAHGKSVAKGVGDNDDVTSFPQDAAELIVRLVNAEPEIVAALEAADGEIRRLLDLLHGYGTGTTPAGEQVRAALAKVRP